MIESVHQIVVLLLLALFGFLYYVRPKLTVLNSIKSNKELFNLLLELQSYRKYNEYNYIKFNINLQRFFNVYLEIHDYDVNKNIFIKLKKLKSKTVKYMNRIPFYLDNDVILSQKLYNLIFNINNILESLLFNASEKLDIFYNSANLKVYAQPQNNEYI